MESRLNTIYIETSIPSFYYTLRTDPESIARRNWTHQWWRENSESEKLTLMTSAAVIAELRRGTSEKTTDRIALLDDLEILTITDEIVHIAHIYIDKLVMPKDPKGDALHLAIASYYKVDTLLTWNCRHLANANKFNHIRRVNYEIGLPTPILATPLNYLNGEN
jgi:predicted nucleic acid-binding protein